MAFNDLKAGDEVVVQSFSTRRVARVARVTKTRIVIGTGAGGEVSYRRDTGREIGGGAWHCTYLQLATPELLTEVRGEQRRRALLAKLIDCRWADLPTETLEAVAVLIPAVAP